MTSHVWSTLLTLSKLRNWWLFCDQTQSLLGMTHTLESKEFRNLGFCYKQGRRRLPWADSTANFLCKLKHFWFLFLTTPLPPSSFLIFNTSSSSTRFKCLPLLYPHLLTVVYLFFCATQEMLSTLLLLPFKSKLPVSLFWILNPPAQH